jgi:hypothetical protein
MTRTSRRFLAAVVTMVAAAAICVTLLAYYANHVLANSAGFSGRAMNVVLSNGVESLIVDRVTDRVTQVVGDESGVQPEIDDAVREALSNGQVSAEIREAAESLQNQLTSGDANSLTLTLPEIGASLASSVESTSPELADELRGIGTVTVLDVPIPPADASAFHDLATAGSDSTLLLVLTCALAVLALVVSPDRRRTVIGLGLGAFVSGLLAAGIYLVGRGLVVREFSGQDARTAARAVWSVYLGGLKTWGLLLAGIGAIVSIVAALVRAGRSDPQAYRAGGIDGRRID